MWGRCQVGDGQGLLCASTPNVDGAVQVDTTGSKPLSIDRQNCLVSETIDCFILGVTVLSLGMQQIY